jgi:hypothetical protein
MSLSTGVNRICLIIKGLGIAWAVLLIAVGGTASLSETLVLAGLGLGTAWLVAWVIEGFAAPRR